MRQFNKSARFWARGVARGKWAQMPVKIWARKKKREEFREGFGLKTTKMIVFRHTKPEGVIFSQ